MKIRNIIIITLIVLLAVYFGYGFYLRIIATGMCKQECEDRGYEDSKLVPNGKLDLNDLCICIDGDKVEGFYLKPETCAGSITTCTIQG